MRRTGLLLLVFILLIGCSEDKPSYQFELLKNDYTGLDFHNDPKMTLDFNVFNYMYFYNGGGVSCGDFNNDGYTDLYFTSNQGKNKMFLNKGNMKFEDITDQSGTQGEPGWTTGTSVVDINNDGLLDLYVSMIGEYQVLKGNNHLYVCLGIENGIPVYEDQAEKYGLDLKGFSTQAVFFDFDQDGDLDMYQLNHSLHQNGTFGQKASFQGSHHETSGDRLLRNEDGKFVDITVEAGINSTVIGYGLGIATADVNRDGWPDIYVANDFHENDYLYINQKDGTFREVLEEQINHTSRFSMGVDIGDINNDGWGDIISLDMLPSDPYILKTSLAEDSYAIFNFKLGYGYNYQYARNNLQLNNGNGTFSEIGLFSKIFATDWSWAPLLMDFDQDGYNDLFVSNGIPRRMNDIDYLNYRLGDDDIKWKTANNYLDEDELGIVEMMPKIKLPNKFFRNTKDLRFEDISDLVKDNSESFSNGAVYADLDNDGDLDIVVNNIEDSPFVYKNLTSENRKDGLNYLEIEFEGSPKNINGIGAMAIVFKGDEVMIHENFPVRGYQSSVDFGLSIGVGDTTSVDSVYIVWPDQTYEKLSDLSFNTETTVKWKARSDKFDYTWLEPRLRQSNNFEDITSSTGINYTHTENEFVEFNRETLIPHMVSTEGPALAVGDLNGDGLDDVFFGSSKRFQSRIYFQNPDGSFGEHTSEIILKDSIYEDVDAVLEDIDTDGDLDIVIASGGNEWWGDSEYRLQRIYLNEGNGEFKSKINLPGVYMTASCVLPSDINNDGLVDLFFGGRAVPKSYGDFPESYLFINQGNGVFEDQTVSYNKELLNVGLVKDGSWSDIDKDGDEDLILAMEWDSILIFRNDGNTFSKVKLSDLKGWWSFVLPKDFDGDGDIDILAGNTGMNSKLSPSVDEPIRLYIEDFDDNGQTDQILTYYVDHNEIPFATYKELTTQLVTLKKKYLYAKDLAKATMDELFTAEKLRSAHVLEATTLKSYYFENDGNNNFTGKILPDEFQFSPLEAACKINNTQDVMVGGNFYENNIEMGRYDALQANILSFNDDEMKVSAFADINVKGQVRRIEPINISGNECFVLVRNNDSAVIIQRLNSEKNTNRELQ